MPRDVSGNYTLPTGNPVVSGTIIDVAWANPTMADLAVQLNNVLTRDGLLAPTTTFTVQNGSSGVPGLGFIGNPTTGLWNAGTSAGYSFLGSAIFTANATELGVNKPINMNTAKIGSLAPGTLRTDAATLGQVQDESASLLTTVAGTTAITANCSTPALATYVVGLRLTLIATADSTGPVTLNVNALGAKNVMIGSVQASNQDILTGKAYTLVYDGTSFQLSGGGGGSGALAGGVFYENNRTLTSNYTVSSTKGAHTVGPLIINTGVVFTIPTNSRVVIL